MDISWRVQMRQSDRRIPGDELSGPQIRNWWFLEFIEAPNQARLEATSEGKACIARRGCLDQPRRRVNWLVCKDWWRPMNKMWPRWSRLTFRKSENRSASNPSLRTKHHATDGCARQREEVDAFLRFNSQALNESSHKHVRRAIWDKTRFLR